MQVLRSAVIFCQVIDNYGDAGVCWRLARQLAQQEKLQVTLWMDDVQALQRLRPHLDPTLATQECDGFTLCRWDENSVPNVEVDMVIEAFGCRLPNATITAMVAMQTPPVWINLEYLSAEKWVEQSHGLPSPHPQYALTKYFYFPGFSQATGGLLKESFVDSNRSVMNNDEHHRRAFAQRLGFMLDPQSTLVSLFCYPSAPIKTLLDVLQTGTAVTCLIPEGVAVDQLTAYFSTMPKAGMQLQRGVLSCHITPFLEPYDFDRLLTLCDVNFVRGEASFVRAQWAATPLIWEAYPQAEAVHLDKLQSFLDCYLRECDAHAAQIMQQFARAWNAEQEAELDWSSLQAQLPHLQLHALQWCGHLSSQTELARGLVRFAAERKQTLS